MNALRLMLAKVPRPLRAATAAFFSLLAGLAVALILNYVLFRIGLPSKPFIYAAF